VPPSSVLIVDDDPDVLNALKVLLEDEFDEVYTESNTARIPRLLNEKYEVILLDMNFSAGINTGNEGLFWLSKIREADENAAVVMMTAYGNIHLAVEAIKRGAKDFVLKPWDNDKLIATLRAAKRTSKSLKPSVESKFSQSSTLLQGKSPVMLRLQEQIKKVASTEASVLILGENGTGKELVAKEIHRLSTRSKNVFLHVDLSTIAPTLFESELFGHKKGSFTDARADRTGRFEAASGGTLFLDEIGNLALAQQAKLLTVLQNGEVVPVGSNEAVKVNIRLLSATNAPLIQLSEQGLFRQDLLYRINTITLHVPPLRERGDDVIELASHFLEQFVLKYAKPKMTIDEKAKAALYTYSWPGNVRELMHTIEKAVILSDSPILTEADLNLSISGKATVDTKGRTLDEIEKEALINALNECGGNVVQAAKSLGITRQTIYNKMKKYGI
jgi:DNA-binding NtrC family response regulator